MRYLFWLIIIVVAIFAGYSLGKILNKPENNIQLTENYSFVKEIAELASLEVKGTTTLKSSNVNNDGSFSDDIRRLFIEKTVRLSAPYSAKFGVDLQDSSLRIIRTDSVLKVYLPKPKLLSYELHLDRLETSNRKGWLRPENDEAYITFQKKMYSEGRAQLENNNVFLNRSRDKVCGIIQRYFAPLGVRTVCIYGEEALPPQQANP